MSLCAAHAFFLTPCAAGCYELARQVRQVQVAETTDMRALLTPLQTATR